MLISVSDRTVPVTSLDVWGKAGWDFLLACALRYPRQPSKERQLAMRNFLEAVGSVLPCGNCSVHFREAVRSSLTDKSLASREPLVRWMYRVQDEIRARQGRAPIGFRQRLRQCMTGSHGEALMRCTYKQACVALALIVLLLVLFIALKR